MSFTPETYEQIRDGAQRSASVIVPVIHRLLKPDSVIDVGCGEGWFAREFAKQGSKVVAADETVEEDMAFIDGVTFLKRTLPTGFSTNYDLAVCLEVAEHLPEEDADHLVRSLCEAATLVLFSAAIPGQGGLGHLNEQWPSYWTTHFARNGFEGHDCLRPRFWNDARIEPWYRQNLVLYVREFSPLLNKPEIERAGEPLDIVHPDIYGWRIEERDRLHRILYAPSVGGEGDGTVWNGP